MKERLENCLRLERTRLNLTQAELAELVGFSRRTINSVEKGVFVPSTVLSLKIAAALGRTVEEIFFLKTDEG